MSINYITKSAKIQQTYINTMPPFTLSIPLLISTLRHRIMLTLRKNPIDHIVKALTSKIKLLSDAGYSMANTDPKLWTKTGGAIDNHSLDNIAYKGVTISNFTCEITNLSDHYALTCTVSVD